MLCVIVGEDSLLWQFRHTLTHAIRKVSDSAPLQLSQISVTSCMQTLGTDHLIFEVGVGNFIW